MPPLRRGARAGEGVRPHHPGRLRRRRRVCEGAASRRGATANAIAIAGTSLNALRVTRTGELSQWKGLAYPFDAFGAVDAAFLAARGVTGPPEVFEGNKGFMEAIAGQFEIDWEHEDLERVRRTILKRYNAEIHSQSAIEALLELRAAHESTRTRSSGSSSTPSRSPTTSSAAARRARRRQIRTKEQADHSLPYLLAVALLDGQVMPEQFTPRADHRERTCRTLLQRVEVRPATDLSRRFPDGARLPAAPPSADGTTLAPRRPTTRASRPAR